MYFTKAVFRKQLQKEKEKLKESHSLLKMKLIQMQIVSFVTLPFVMHWINPFLIFFTQIMNTMKEPQTWRMEWTAAGCRGCTQNHSLPPQCTKKTHCFTQKWVANLDFGSKFATHFSCTPSCLRGHMDVWFQTRLFLELYILSLQKSKSAKNYNLLTTHHLY